MVVRAEDYPWSSTRAHLEGAADAVQTDHPILAVLGATVAQRQAAYRELFRVAVDETWMDELRAATNGGWAFGSERFKQQIAAAAGRRATPDAQGRRPEEEKKDDRQQLGLL